MNHTSLSLSSEITDRVGYCVILCVQIAVIDVVLTLSDSLRYLRWVVWGSQCIATLLLPAVKYFTHFKKVSTTEKGSVSWSIHCVWDIFPHLPANSPFSLDAPFSQLFNGPITMQKCTYDLPSITQQLFESEGVNVGRNGPRPQRRMAQCLCWFHLAAAPNWEGANGRKHSDNVEVHHTTSHQITQIITSKFPDVGPRASSVLKWTDSQKQHSPRCHFKQTPPQKTTTTKGLNYRKQKEAGNYFVSDCLASSRCLCNTWRHIVLSALLKAASAVVWESGENITTSTFKSPSRSGGFKVSQSCRRPLPEDTARHREQSRGLMLIQYLLTV